VEAMMEGVDVGPMAMPGTGETLGGGSTVSPEEARKAQLARFLVVTPSKQPQPKTKMKPEEEDVERKDAMEETTIDPTASLNPESIQMLTGEMANGTVEGAVDWLLQRLAARSMTTMTSLSCGTNSDNSNHVFLLQLR
jgi:hypothetical protein